MLRSTLVLLLLSAAALVGASSLGAATSPRCFGAASLDPGHRCLNPALSRLVTPSPRDARRQPNAPCAVLAAEGALKPCAFGTPQRRCVHLERARSLAHTDGDEHHTGGLAMSPVTAPITWSLVSL